MYLLQQIIPQNLNSSQWEDLFVVQSKINKKYGFVPEDESLESFIDSCSKKYLANDNSLFEIIHGETTVGLLRKWADKDWGNNDEIRISCLTITGDLGEDFLEIIKDYISCELSKQHSITLYSYNYELESVASELKGKTVMNENFWSFKREDFNLQMFDEWCAEVGKSNPNLRLEMFEYVPDDLVDEYCNLFMDTTADMPENDEEAFVSYNISPEFQRERNKSFRETGIRHIWSGLFDEKNELVGMSNIRYTKSNPKFAYQFMISTRKDYRGKKLGKWLYASLYKRLYEEEPGMEMVYLFHHENNVPAYSLSKKIGYQKGYSEMVYKLQI